MSNGKRVVKAILVSAAATVIGYLINFFLTAYITEHVGIDAYGFVTVSRTFINYASVITTALTVFIARYISVNYHQNEMEEANAYFSSAIKACTVLSIVLFSVALILAYKLETVLVIPDRLVNSVKILFVVMFAGFAFTTITTPFQSAAYIKNRLDITGFAKIVSYVVEALVLLGLFYFFEPNIWFAGIGSLSAASVIFLFNYILSKKITPELKYSRVLVSTQKIKNLVKNGVWSSVNQLGNILNSGLDLWIANIFLSGIEMGEIAVAKTVGSIFGTLISVVYQPLHPQMLKSYASGDTKVFMTDLTRSMKICGFFGATIFAGFFALGDLYFRLWLPNENSSVLHVLTLLTVTNYITESVVMPLYYVSTLTVKNKVPCWVTIAGGMLNVLGMYVLLNTTNMGVYAVVITTAVIMVSINLFFNPNYSAWCLKASPKPIYMVIVRHLVACLLITMLFKFIGVVLSPYSWITLVATALLMVAVGALVYIPIVCSRKEINSITTIIKNKVIKLGGSR